MRNFRTYKVWHHGIELITNVYTLTQQLPKAETYSLASQMQRAAVSIPSNFSEGCARESEKDFKRFVEIALGSAFELETQMIVADNLYKIGKHDMYQETFNLLHKLQAELNALRNKLKK